MAGDWIKMRVDLATSPKVVRIASALRADRLRVVGGLHAVWSLFDVHSEDGRLDGYTPEALDELIGFPGFCSAMESVGWIEDCGDFLAVPRFDEHNGKSAKRRATETERKREARKVSASDADKTRSREEKRREEVNPKTKTPKPPTPGKPARFDPIAIDLPDCVTPEAWGRWIGYRRSRKLTTAEQTVRGQAAKLAEWHGAGHDPTAIIDASITNGWQGLFEPKQQGSNRRESYDDKLQRTADALTGRNRINRAAGEAGRTLDGQARPVD